MRPRCGAKRWFGCGRRSVARRTRRAQRRVAATVLSVAELTKHYGGVIAVDDVSFDVVEGQTLGIIGPNGAGKTTLFELIGGFTKPDAGTRHVRRTRRERDGGRSGAASSG